MKTRQHGQPQLDEKDEAKLRSVEDRIARAQREIEACRQAKPAVAQ